MKTISFDQRNHGACPGCGVFDHGNHIVHRYFRNLKCPHSFHASEECTDKKVITRQKAVTAKFHRWIQKELEAKL